MIFGLETRPALRTETNISIVGLKPKKKPIVRKQMSENYFASCQAGAGSVSAGNFIRCSLCGLPRGELALWLAKAG